MAGGPRGGTRITRRAGVFIRAILASEDKRFTGAVMDAVNEAGEIPDSQTAP